MRTPAANRPPHEALADDARGKSDLLQLVEAQTHALGASVSASLPAVAVGTYRGLNDQGDPVVEYARETRSHLVGARTVVRLSDDDVDRGVVLAFEDGDASRPIILGLVQPSASLSRAACESQPEVVVDGARVTIAGQREVTLRCGQASITLTRAGKVVIRGTYVVSRSEGPNRIKGASVDIN